MRRFFCRLLAVVLFAFVSCNEDNSTSMMQALASSQKRSDKVWSQAEFVLSTDEEDKVDYVAMIANDGLYIVGEDTDQESLDFLKEPTVGNNDGDYGIGGIIRNLYVPSNYASPSVLAGDSSKTGCLVIQTVSKKLNESGKFYAVALADCDDMKEDSVIPLVPDAEGWTFVSRSQVSGSSLVLLRKSIGDEYGYAVAGMKVGDIMPDGKSRKLQFDVKKEFSSPVLFSTFWEDDFSSPNALVLFSTSGDDIKEQEYYAVKLDGTSAPNHHTQLSELSVRFFVVYDDASFMAISQSGTVIHSKSSRSHMYTSDSSFSYDRYTVPVVFRRDKEKGASGVSAEPDITIFARYSGNGFIIYSYNRNLNDKNRIYNSETEYKGHVQTSSYATNLRSEDISEVKGVTVKDDSGERCYRILVLSTENGISTFGFDSTLPPQMKTNGKEFPNRVNVF